jgi:hypothetical protein
MAATRYSCPSPLWSRGELTHNNAMADFMFVGLGMVGGAMIVAFTFFVVR